MRQLVKRIIDGCIRFKNAILDTRRFAFSSLYRGLAARRDAAATSGWADVSSLVTLSTRLRTAGQVADSSLVKRDLSGFVGRWAIVHEVGRSEYLLRPHLC